MSTKDFLRIIMAMKAHFDLVLHHTDVRITFLNGDLVGGCLHVSTYWL